MAHQACSITARVERPRACVPYSFFGPNSQRAVLVRVLTAIKFRSYYVTEWIVLVVRSEASGRSSVCRRQRSETRAACRRVFFGPRKVFKLRRFHRTFEVLVAV